MSNFSFLAIHSPLLADLGATAEKLYPFDPASCVLKLRMAAESPQAPIKRGRQRAATTP